MEEGKTIAEKITAQLEERGIVDDGQEKAETKIEKVSEIPEDKTEKGEKQPILDRDSSEVEREAMKKGWKPDGPKSAEEYLRAEPLYEELKQRGKEIKELKSTLDELASHIQKQKELSYRQALEDLKRERQQAIEFGDVKSVDEIEQKIAAVNPEISTDAASPEVEAFLERNTKWVKDPTYEAQKIREFAARRDQELVPFELSPKEHLEVIERDIRKQFRQFFEGEESLEPKSKVESSGTSATVSAKKKKFGFSDLSPEQKTCARHFEKRGVMTVEKYIEQLAEIGELE